MDVGLELWRVVSTDGKTVDGTAYGKEWTMDGPMADAATVELMAIDLGFALAS